MATWFHGQDKNPAKPRSTNLTGRRRVPNMVLRQETVMEFRCDFGVPNDGLSAPLSIRSRLPLIPCLKTKEIAMVELSRRAAMAGAAATALMPLTMTAARAAAPLAEKQNASFYRYNVGTHQVTVVCDGVATVNLADNYSPNATKDQISKVLADSHLPTDKITHTFSPVVVNTGPKLVVIDTGLGLAQFEQSKGRTGQFHNNLAAANIDRNNVDTVIISHFHGDHINGLLAADNKAAFANAEIMPRRPIRFRTGVLARQQHFARNCV